MPRYVTQFGINPAAWAKLAPAPKDRADALGKRLEGLGVRLVDLYQAFGGTYDGTAVYDAEDDAGADAATVAVRAVGPGRALQTFRLQPGEHQRDALRRLSDPLVSATAPGRPVMEPRGIEAVAVASPPATECVP